MALEPNVDIAPAFRFTDGTLNGQYLIAHTPDGGKWRLSNPVAEYAWLQQTDAATAGKVTHLIKMLKAWKRECNVEMKSICLEVLANVFVTQWEYNQQTIFYYDWMIRDFFAFENVDFRQILYLSKIYEVLENLDGVANVFVSCSQGSGARKLGCGGAACLRAGDPVISCASTR